MQVLDLKKSFFKKKVLVSEKNNINYLHIFFFDKIYSLCGINIKKNSKIIEVPENCISLSDDSQSQYNASILTEDFLKKKFNSNYINFFEQKNNQNIFALDLKKKIAIEISKFLKVFFLAKKISSLNPNYKIYLYPEKINLEVLLFLKKKFKNIYLSKIIITDLFFRDFFKLIVSFFLILILPEVKILLSFKKSSLKFKKRFFLIGYNLFPYQDFDGWPNNDFLIKNNHLSKNEILFIFNSNFFRSFSNFLNLNKWERCLKKNDYNFFSLNNASSFISLKDYIKFIYRDASNLRFFLIKNIFFLRFLNIKSLDLLYLYINWRIFFRLFKIKNFLSSMVFGENITNYLNQNNSESTSFLYFSTTALQHSSEKLLENFSDLHQYSFSFYDNFIGSKISYSQFAYRLQNVFKNYLDVGSISSYKIFSSKKNVTLFKLRLYEKKKIICFFDSAIGYGGHVGPAAYYEYLDLINNFSKLHTNFYIIFKIKTSFDKLQDRSNYKVFTKMQKIKKNKNLLVFDNSNLSKLNLDAHDLLAVSDIAIHLPISSLIFDGLSANIQTIIYDPEKNYKNKEFFYSQHKNLYYVNKFLLNNRINYILNYHKQISYKLTNNFLRNKIYNLNDAKSPKRLVNYFYDKNN